MNQLTTATKTGGPVLEVEHLRTTFATELGPLRAVDDVSFTIRPGEVFAVVGESGCGKTVTAMSILSLLPKPAGRIEGGRILYHGQDLVTAGEPQLRAIRGDRIAMIFQDPLTALNPVHRIGAQIVELIRAHRDISKADAWAKATELLGVVGIPQPAERVTSYPHEFSGGMRQRAMIAMAVALDPDLLIADEPTTALDVTVQAQILDVLLGIRQRLKTAVMLITHDLGVVAETADRVMVMYAGQSAEQAPADTLFAKPRHPYTWGLLASTTRIDRPRTGRMHQIPGAPPSLLDPPKGCRFAPRCPYAQAVCHEVPPPTIDVSPLHQAACHFADRPDWEPEKAAESLLQDATPARAGQ